MPRQLTKVNIVGSEAAGNGQYTVYVRNISTGAVSSHAITAAQYTALIATQGMGHLAEPGEEVLYATAGYRFDTPSGRLEDGQCAQVQPGRWLVKRDASTRAVTLDQEGQPSLTQSEDDEVTNKASR